MTIVGKKTMRIAAVVIIAALVMLMLPLTAKAAEITKAIVVLDSGSVVEVGGHSTVDDDVLFALWGDSGSYDSILVDASNKVITIKNLNSENSEFSTGVSGWTFLFDGTNKLGVFIAEDLPIGSEPDSDHKIADITVDVTPGSSLEVKDGISKADKAKLTLATGVVATPENLIGGNVGGTLTREAESDTPSENYIINDGSTDPIIAKTGSDLVIKCSGPLEHLSKVLMDGKDIPDGSAELSEGSTILTLKSAYLATLAAGEHTVSFVYDDGTTVDATFNLVTTPQTGDNFSSFVLMGAIAAGVVLVAAGSRKLVNNQ